MIFFVVLGVSLGDIWPISSTTIEPFCISRTFPDIHLGARGCCAMVGAGTVFVVDAGVALFCRKDWIYPPPYPAPRLMIIVMVMIRVSCCFDIGFEGA